MKSCKAEQETRTMVGMPVIRRQSVQKSIGGTGTLTKQSTHLTPLPVKQHRVVWGLIPLIVQASEVATDEGGTLNQRLCVERVYGWAKSRARIT